MSTHTKGPWRDGGHRQIIAGEGRDMQVICECWSGGVGIEAADANICLIAAAPDLLEALEWVINAEQHTDKRGVMVDMPEALRRARVAIAKATGEQQ